MIHFDVTNFNVEFYFNKKKSFLQMTKYYYSKNSDIVCYIFNNEPYWKTAPFVIK
jgi:hypothetical protein